MEIDFIDFYVTDAAQMRDWSIEQLGLQAVDDRSTEHTQIYLVGNTHLQFSISSPLTPTSPVADYLKLHSAGIRNISFRVQDLSEIRSRIDRFNVEILAASDPDVELPWLSIKAWGTLEHTITQTPTVDSIDPGSVPTEQITGIDHLVLNVANGKLAAAVTWYQQIFDFQIQQTFEIQTDRSGLASKALISPDGKIRFNINQPISPASQIQSFLDANHGAGIQHIALHTNDIFATIDQMQRQGMDFLPIPAAYYTALRRRAQQELVTNLTPDKWQMLERLQILLDWSPDKPSAILMQIFTQPLFHPQTFFLEIIERRNRATGFGQGNFQALFEAIEHQQIN